MSENEDLRNQVTNLTCRNSTNQLNHQHARNDSQLPSIVAELGLVSRAEEAREEFLSKAIGTAIDWVSVPLPKMRNPFSHGTIYVSSSCIGAAARAYATISLEPCKVIEILKDRTSWSRHCRNMDVVAQFPANNGGSIELIYTQYYAPTMMASARDFWTLRYTCLLEDGCFVMCEKSISSCDGAPSSPVALEFVRGQLLASGYVIRPTEGGSTIYLVEHLNLEANSFVPEAVRPLYESSNIMAKKIIISALNHIDNVVNENNGHQKPTLVRSFGHRLSRGFNDAVNCFSEDGWALMSPNASDDVITCIKRTDNFGPSAIFDTVICVKSSLQLQNVSPAKMVKFLKERRSNWMSFNFTTHSEAFCKAACFAFPGMGAHNLSGTAVLVGHTNYEDEIMEIVRFDSIAHGQHNTSSGDLYHLQISSGMGDNEIGTCSELIFSAVDKSIPGDAVLLSSGFRIYAGTNSSSTSAYNDPSAVVTMAFQFPFQAHLVEDVEAMARDYIRHVVSSVKQISLEAMVQESNAATNFVEVNPLMEAMMPVSNTATNFVGENPLMEAMMLVSNTCTNFVQANQAMEEFNAAINLSNLMCHSYRSYLGVDMLGINFGSAVSVLEQMQNHPYAILCFSLVSVPACIYFNQAALNMLETTPDNMQLLSMDSILGRTSNLSMYSILPTILQQGYAMMPPGNILSAMNRFVWYGQAVVWQVLAADGSLSGLGLAFVDWCFNQLL